MGKGRGIHRPPGSGPETRKTRHHPRPLRTTLSNGPRDKEDEKLHPLDFRRNVPGGTLAPPAIATDLASAVRSVTNPSSIPPAKTPDIVEAPVLPPVKVVLTEIKAIIDPTPPAESGLSLGGFDLTDLDDSPKIANPFSGKQPESRPTIPWGVPQEETSQLKATIQEALNNRPPTEPPPESPTSRVSLPEVSNSILKSIPSPPPHPVESKEPQSTTPSSSPTPASIPSDDFEEQPTQITVAPTSFSTLPPHQRAWYKNLSGLPVDNAGFLPLQREYMRDLIKATELTSDDKEKIVLESICVAVEEATDQESLTKALEKLNAHEFSEEVRKVLTQTEETFYEKANIEADRRALQRLREFLPLSITILEGFKRLGHNLLSTQLSIGPNKFEFSFDPSSFDIVAINFLGNNLHNAVLQRFSGRSLMSNKVVQALSKTLETIAKNPNKVIATNGNSKLALALGAAGIITASAATVGLYVSRGDSQTDHTSTERSPSPPPSVPPADLSSSTASLPSIASSHPSALSPTPVSSPISAPIAAPTSTPVHAPTVTHAPVHSPVARTVVSTADIEHPCEESVGSDRDANTERALIDILIRHSCRDIETEIDVGRSAHLLNRVVLKARLNHALRDREEAERNTIERNFIELEYDTTALVNTLRSNGDRNGASRIIRLRTRPGRDNVVLERQEVRGQRQLRVIVERDGRVLYSTDWLRESRVLRTRG